MEKCSDCLVKDIQYHELECELDVLRCRAQEKRLKTSFLDWSMCLVAWSVSFFIWYIIIGGSIWLISLVRCS